MRVGTPEIKGGEAVCHVYNEAAIIHTETVAHCASEGLGGYCLSDLEAARREVAGKCQAWLSGYEAALIQLTPSQ
jgi:hypothetical protein